MYVQLKNKTFFLSEERLEELILKGSVHSSAIVSVDGKNWVTWDVYKNGEPQESNLELSPHENLKFWENENGKLPIEPEDVSFLPIEEPKTWCFSINGMKKEGPCSTNEIVSLVKNGVLTKDSIIWKDGQSKSYFLKDHPLFSPHLLLSRNDIEPPPKTEKSKNPWLAKIKDVFRLIQDNLEKPSEKPQASAKDENQTP